MKDAKSHVRELLDRLPDDCTIEDVQYHLYVADLLEHRSRMADEGGLIDHDDIERFFEQCRSQSAG